MTGWPPIRPPRAALYWQRLADIADMAEREAKAGAPAAMVAVYVRLACMHAIGDHMGAWQKLAAVAKP